MYPDISYVLLSEEQLQAKVQELAASITHDYQGKNLLLLGLLKGSVVFMTDLMRKIDLPLSIDFISVSSYGAGTESSGVVRIMKDLDRDISPFDVLIVEDILDSGRTLSYLLEWIRGKNPRSVRVAALLNKPDRREREVALDYEGYVIPDEFVVGYGLDFAEKYRNLPYIGVLSPEAFS